MNFNKFMKNEEDDIIEQSKVDQSNKMYRQNEN